MSSSPPNITSAGTRQFTVVAYKTEAEARAWCVSQQELFDRVEVWLADNLLHPYTFDREPFAGVRFVDEGLLVGPDGALRVPIDLENAVKNSLRDWSITGHWRVMRRGHFKSAQAQAAWAAILFA